MIHSLLDFLRAVVAFAVVLGVLVFFHELGHYLAARWRGVHVEAFSIGFGRALTHWTDRKGTVWKLAWLPLGGYVKMNGMERIEDAPPERRALWVPGRTFHEKSVGSRAIIVAAGPAANFVLAAVLFFLLFATYGRPATTLPVVSAVLPNSAAAHAGLMAGDRIVRLGGQAIPDFTALQKEVASHPGARVAATIEHDGSQRTVEITLGSTEASGKRIGLLGIQGGAVVYEREPVGKAAWEGVKETWNITSQTVMGLVHMLTTRSGAEDLGGPVRIAQLSGQVAALGLANLVTFIAILSINLGLINLFPIPVLDGGYLIFFLFEALRGRPLPPRAQDYGFRAGFALLVGIMVFATWNDLGHLGLFR